MEPLSDDELGKLDDLLLSDDLSEECMLAVTVEGFLTAIAIGPVTVTPAQWLPRVFGGDPEDSMPGSRYWMRSPPSCDPSSYLPHRKAGQNWMRRRTRRRCMRSGPAKLNRRSTLYMRIGYLIEKAQGKPWLLHIPRERQESRRWGAMRLALVGAERNTDIAVVPDVHRIDPTVGNA